MGGFFKILIAAALVSLSTPSFAQATRTWVSGVGDDVNPCSRTAPTFGSVLNSGTNGINVNDSATATLNTIEVILRGISIDGGGSLAGLNGIRFTSGRSLVLEDVFVQNENGTTGISIQPAGAAEFYAENVTATDSAVGILVEPTGATGSIRAVLRNVRAQNNSGAGLSVSSASASAVPGSIVVIDKSAFTGNSNGIVVNGAVGTPQAVVMVTDSVISGNSTAGLLATGATARMRIANSTITSNTTGLSISASAIINTYGTNRLDGNGTNGTFTAPVLPQQ
jgi:hypothetical protein